jgi:hypothetical protein
MSLFPKNLNEYVAQMGIPRGPKSKAFLVDTVNGSDSNPGTSWLAPLKTLEAAEDMCTANRHDTVLFLAGATADNPTASITWDKAYTHLIGVGSYLPGLGQRSRVVMKAATKVTPVITFAGNGCIVKNMQFFQEKAAGAASGVAIVTGNRCYFENVFFAMPCATDAASYCLKVGSDENVFKRCTIGQHTYVRTGASRNLWIYGADATRNKFIECEFLSWSSATTHVHAYIDVAVTCEAFTVHFENCLWQNIVAGAGTLAVAVDDNCATTDHQVLFRGYNQMAGITAVADPLTYTMVPDADDSVSGLLMIAAVES